MMVLLEDLAIEGFAVETTRFASLESCVEGNIYIYIHRVHPPKKNTVNIHVYRLRPGQGFVSLPPGVCL